MLHSPAHWGSLSGGPGTHHFYYRFSRVSRLMSFPLRFIARRLSQATHIRPEAVKGLSIFITRLTYIHARWPVNKQSFHVWNKIGSVLAWNYWQCSWHEETCTFGNNKNCFKSAYLTNTDPLDFYCFLGISSCLVIVLMKHRILHKIKEFLQCDQRNLHTYAFFKQVFSTYSFYSFF